MFEIYNGRSGFWQWDLNQKLILRVPCQVHFCNGTSDCSLVVDSYEHDGMYLADVPNVLMQTSGNLNVFAYIMDHDERYTKVSAVYRVHERSKPADYVYTETEVRNWENVSQEALNMVQSSCDDMDVATKAVRDALESGALKGEKGDPGRDGAEGKPGRDGVDGRDGLDAPQIDDTQITQNNPWSSGKIIDTLCPPFEQAGNPVVCHPVAGYPLGVSVSVEPVQEGSGDPSPDNVRPISVAAQAKVTRCGKNLLTHEPNMVGSYKYILGNAFLVSGTTYTVSFDVPFTATTYMYAYEPGSAIELARFVAGASQATFTYSGNTKEKSIHLYNREVYDPQPVTAWQLEIGSTATPYEPYHGDTYTIDLPEGFAGGTVDVTGREAEKIWATYVFDGTEHLSIANVLNNVVRTSYTPVIRAAQTLKSYCSHLPNIIDYLQDSAGHYCNNIIYIKLPLEILNSADIYGVKEYLAAQYAAGTPVTVCYRTVTPTKHAIAPQPIPAISGTNTLMTDAQGMTVTGRADPVHKIQELEQAILSLGGNV